MFLTYECYTVCSAVLKTNFLKPMGMLAATNNCCHSGSVMQVDVLHKVTFSCSSTNTLQISAQPTCPCPSPNIQKPMDWFIFNDGDTVSSYFLQTGQVSTGHQATSEYGANASPVPSMSHDAYKRAEGEPAPACKNHKTHVICTAGPSQPHPLYMTS